MRKLDLNNPFNAGIYHEDTVSSTMITARVLAKEGMPHGTVICTDHQEAGRGRQGRSWQTKKAENLMFTILLYYGDFISIPRALTLRAGLAVSLAIEDLVPELSGMVKVKWPNDVIIATGKVQATGKVEATGKVQATGKVEATGKVQATGKVAGILAETDGGNVYLGIGINVMQKEFPEEFRGKALGIAQVQPDLAENARFTLLELVLSRLYGEFEAPRLNPAASGGSCWRNTLQERLYKRGETVTFAEGDANSSKITRGILGGIGPQGELIIKGENEGEDRFFSAGELRVY